MRGYCGYRGNGGLHRQTARPLGRAERYDTGLRSEAGGDFSHSVAGPREPKQIDEYGLAAIVVQPDRRSKPIERNYFR